MIAAVLAACAREEAKQLDTGVGSWSASEAVPGETTQIVPPAPTTDSATQASDSFGPIDTAVDSGTVDTALDSGPVDSGMPVLACDEALTPFPTDGGVRVWDVAVDGYFARITGEEEDQTFGQLLTAAGDVDGDGVGDVLSWAWEGPDGPTFAWLVFGPVDGEVTVSEVGIRLRNDPDFVPPAISWFGTGMTGLGDADGDGRGDFAVVAGNFADCDIAMWTGAPGGPGDVAFAQDAPSYIRTAGYPNACAAWLGGADVTGDGLTDLVAVLEPQNLAPPIGNSPNAVTVYAAHEPLGVIDSSDATAVISDAGRVGFNWAGIHFLGDHNGDGVSDLGIACEYDGASPYEDLTLDPFVTNSGSVRVLDGPLLDGRDPVDADGMIYGMEGEAFARENAVNSGDLDGDGTLEMGVDSEYRFDYLPPPTATLIFQGPFVGERRSEDAWLSLVERVDDLYQGTAPMVGSDLDLDGHDDLLVKSLNPHLPGGVDPAENDDGGAYIFYGPLECGHYAPDEVAHAILLADAPYGLDHVATDWSGDGYPDLLFSSSQAQFGYVTAVLGPL